MILRIVYAQRCREEYDQCGANPPAVCHKMPDRYAWECPHCGRFYPHGQAQWRRDQVAVYWLPGPVRANMGGCELEEITLEREDAQEATAA